MTVDVVIPVYKPDKSFLELIEKLQAQTVKPGKIILINTEEKYFNNLIAESDFTKNYDNVVIEHIKKSEFNHGRARNMGAELSTADVMIFMTQDAFPYDEKLFAELLRPIEEGSAAVSYAKQLPREDATLIEAFSRQFNYPGEDRLKLKKDLPELGIKTYFCSNVCAAYNAEIFNKLGCFVDFTIFNEDMLFAAKLIAAGYGIYYCSNAKVVHSHNYSGKQQLRRNFDLGVSQADHPEVFDGIKSEGEGIKMVKKTIVYLIKRGRFYLIPYLCYLSFCKLRGYRLGKGYKKLSKKQVLKYTMSPDYFKHYFDDGEVPQNVYEHLEIK